MTQAFPVTDANEPGVNGDKGMTLRDYFAAAALQGLLANPKVFTYEAPGDDRTVNSIDDCDLITEMAFDFADAMLKD